MQQLAWGDTLCGVEVTPDAWIGGVIGHDVLGWGILRVDNQHDHHFTGLPEGPALYYHDARDNMRRYFGGVNEKPIMPPRGFAGRTDAELWAAVFGPDDPHEAMPCFCSPMVAFWRDGSWILIDPATGQPATYELTADLLQPTHLAIGNALVLHARLTEARDG